MIDIAERIERAFALYGERPALAIGGIHYSYGQVRQRVLAIQKLLDSVAQPGDRLVGVAATDCVETYSSVLAILRSGRAFVPLNPEHPVERNANIVEQAGLRIVLSAQEHVSLDEGTSGEVQIVVTSGASVATTTGVARTSPDDLAYLLFTSGSSGEPKGVPISRENLSAFLDALSAAGCAMGDRDRVLQMFDLTFDFSISSYLAPLCSGACVFTVGSGNFKFAEVYRLLSEERLTVAPMVPSVLTYLRPYFDDIRLPELRLSFFCGEALRADVATAWGGCTPGSSLVNFYGPTEATVFALAYDWKPASGRDKTLNGVVSIGRPMMGSVALIVDDELSPLPPGEKGELCLAGPQLTPGYWHDAPRNARAFFEQLTAGKVTRYYRTGDLAICDAEGDYLFAGRLDHQVKVQGYRVELGEIEHHARELAGGHACVVVPVTAPGGNIELRLVVESYDGDFKAILASLRERVPSYMVPARAVSIPQLPLNANRKIDRRALQRGFEAAVDDTVRIRRALAADIPFLVEAICEAEKAGTDRLSYCAVFELDDGEFHGLLATMLAQDLQGQELCISDFLIAEIAGEPLGACCGWVEGAGGIASSILKANLLLSAIDRVRMRAALKHFGKLEELSIVRETGAIQIESVYVRAAGRGRGVAGLLIAAHLDALRSESTAGKAQVILTATNKAAKAAYERAGFMPAGERWSTDPSLLALVPALGKLLMERFLIVRP